MPSKPQRLELTWINKDVHPLLEPCILLEDSSLSYHTRQRNSKKDRFENMFIFGDNLLALKSLEQKYTGKVKCVLY
jgi:adenine-specific DNA-methyltransferase